MKTKNMGMRAFWAIVAVVLSVLASVGLLDVLTTRATTTGFSVLNWIAFGNGTVELIFAWIVGVLGILTLIGLLVGTLKALFK